MASNSNEDSRIGAFPNTRWSLVLRVAGSNEGSAREALEEICRLYWRPIFSFLRRSGHGFEDARDLTQGFFATMIMGQLLESASRERGRLRSYLLASLKRYLSRHFERTNAQKRGGGIQLVSLDYLSAEQDYTTVLLEGDSPDVLYERVWAQQLMDKAKAALGSRYQSSGKGEQFRELTAFLEWDTTNESYRQAAARMGISETNLRSSVYRLRRQFREALMDQIMETVETRQQAEEELQHLLECLRNNHSSG